MYNYIYIYIIYTFGIWWESYPVDIYIHCLFEATSIVQIVPPCSTPAIGAAIGKTAVCLNVGVGKPHDLAAVKLSTKGTLWWTNVAMENHHF